MLATLPTASASVAHPIRLLFGAQIGRRSAWQHIVFIELGGVKLRRRTTIGQEWTIQDFCIHQNKIPLDEMLRSEALDLATDAKRNGYKIGVLSNELELFHGREWMDSIPLLRDLDYIYDTTHTKILKPDPRAYAIALAGIGLPARQVVFIDDQIRNVRGGTDAGLHGIHLDIVDPQAAFDEARRLLNLR